MSELPKIDEAITPTAETVGRNLIRFVKHAEKQSVGSDEMRGLAAPLRFASPNYQPFIHGTKNKPADPLVHLSKNPPRDTLECDFLSAAKMVHALAFDRPGAIDRLGGKKEILNCLKQLADDLTRKEKSNKSCDTWMEKGCKLWNDGSTWKQVTSELYGDEFDKNLVNATRAAIKRYAKAHKINLRPGGKGGAPKKRPAK